ncbi:MAG: hypothetical protein HC912_04650 [Saprospiraceae bacterium]|nr:hypothetical protein [Saprospiraceae bacterium]
MRLTCSTTKDVETCIHWYIVYTNRITGEVVYEEYLYTTCGNSCVYEECDSGISEGEGGGSIIIEIDDPCTVMQALTQDASFISKMNELGNAATTLNYERGFLMTNQANGISYTTIQGQPNNPEIGFTPNFPLSGLIHSHYTGTYSSFSGQDVRAMYEIYHNGYMIDPLAFTSTVVTSQGTAYTMIIENLNTFLDFLKKISVMKLILIHLSPRITFTLLAIVF